jgi:hypothetical protein
VAQPGAQFEEQGERLPMTERGGRVVSHLALHHAEIIERKGLYQLVADLTRDLKHVLLAGSRSLEVPGLLLYHAQIVESASLPTQVDA